MPRISTSIANDASMSYNEIKSRVDFNKALDRTEDNESLIVVGAFTKYVTRMQSAL